MLKQIAKKTLPMLLGLAFVLGPFLFGRGTALAANPTTINFQGKVVNNTSGNVGTNVADNTYTFVFKLYTVSSGGTAIWTETDSLAVTSGIFQVSLGASCPFFTANTCNNNTPINFNSNPALYLGITFNSDPAGEMTPRVQLQSVPFAYNADNLGGIGASGFIQNTPSVQSSSNFHISGTGQADTALQAPSFDSEASAATLGIGTANAGVITLGNVTNSTFIFKAKTSSTAYQIENSSSKNVLAVDTSANQVLIGTGGTSGINGLITFNTTTASSFTVGLQPSASTTASYVLTLPTSAGSANQCLQNSGTAGILTFASCGSGGSGVTTVGAFSASSQANGATISGTTITFGPADQTNPGMVTVSGTQTFGGNKVFVGSVQVQSASGISIGTSSVAGILALYNGNNTVSIQGASSTNAYTLVLPGTSGTANYCLANTATLGTLQWIPCGGGATTAAVTLAPEFTNATFSGVGGTNTGTLTSDYCAGSSRFPSGENTSVCTSATDEHNYYSWTANSGNSYDIFVRWSVPNDFSSFSSSNNSFYYWTTAASDTVSMTVYNSSSTSCAAQSDGGTAGAWASQAITMTGCTPSAGSVITLDIHLASGANGDFARVGEITLTYNRR